MKTNEKRSLADSTKLLIGQFGRKKRLIGYIIEKFRLQLSLANIFSFSFRIIIYKPVVALFHPPEKGRPLVKLSQ